MKTWIINDFLSVGAGQNTLWSTLLKNIPGAEWAGGVHYPDLPRFIHEKAMREGAPDCVIRNATFFPSLNLRCPTIAFLQDNAMTNGQIKSMQLEVAMKSSLVIFNSPFIAHKYPEITSSCPTGIIPAPVDYEVFKPADMFSYHVQHAEITSLNDKWGIKPDSVCWIGANNVFKGFDLLTDIIRTMPNYNFVVIRKDRGTELDGFPNVRALFALSQEEVAEVINCCRVGLCTSTMESQHLGGLEMGACGLPIVVSDVGAYWGRYSGPWGAVCQYAPQFPMAIEQLMKREPNRQEIREYWLREPFALPKVINNWRAAVEAVTGRTLEAA